MNKAKLLFVFTFPAPAVVLTYGAAAQGAVSVLPKVARVTVNDPVICLFSVFIGSLLICLWYYLPSPEPNLRNAV